MTKMLPEIEKVTYVVGNGRCTRTVYLIDVVVDDHFLRGLEVDETGSRKAPSKAYLKTHGAADGEILHVVHLPLVGSRTPMVADFKYGTLVPKGTATQETEGI